jgi:glycosyltransferase involved in cell wall biosynthesis
MRVLIFTNMYPFPKMPFYGSFVQADAEALRGAGVEVDVYFVNGKANKLYYVGAPFGLMARLRARNYDVIHVHHSFCAFFATMQKNVPVVWTFHEGEITSGNDVIRADSAVKRLAYSKGFKQRMARKADAVVVVSDHLKKPLGRTDAATIPCGVDTGLFRPMDRSDAKSTLGLDPERRYVLFPSTPDRVEKRFDLAQAGVKVYEEREGTALELLCLDDVPHDDVPVYMNACEVFLMTSAFEASPVTVREALSCNVPVISTDVGDVKLVVDGIEGCYIIEPDADDIADKLGQAFGRTAPFAGREGMAGYSMESSSAKLLALYERLIARKKGR